MVRYIPKSNEVQDKNIQMITEATLSADAPSKTTKTRKKLSAFVKSAVSIVLCLVMFAELISPQLVWAATDALTSKSTEIETVPYEKSILFEEPSLREESKKEYRMSDGSYRAIVYPEPIHYQKDGYWEDIDNTLNLDENGGYTNFANDFSVTFAKKSDKKKLVEVKTDDFKLSWGFVGASEDKSAQKKTKITSDDITALNNLSDGVYYADILPNVDVEYLIKSKTLKENIILKNKDAQGSFELELKLNNAQAILKDDRSIGIVLSDGSVAAEIAAPFMYDANGKQSNDIDVALTQSGNKYSLVLTPSEDFLNNPNTEYPVTIDPVIYPFNNETPYYSVTMIENTVRQNLYVGRFYNSSENLSDIAYSFIDVNLPFNPYENIVQNVYIKATAAGCDVDSWTGGASNLATGNKTISIHSVDGPFNTQQGASNAQIGEVLDCVNICVNNGTTIDCRFDVTKYFQGEYSTTGQNYLLMQEYNAPETASAGTLPVAFNNFILEYDYRSPDGIEEYLTYTEASVGAAGTVYIGDATGKVVYAHADIATPGTVMPIVVGSIYQNGKWHTNFNETITKYSVDDSSDPYQQHLYPLFYQYSWVDSDGTRIYFHKTYFQDENGNYTDEFEIADETGKRILLTEKENGNVVLKDTDGNQSEFAHFSDKELRLVSKTDTYGNTITITYRDATSNDISSIYNNLGEKIVFNYTNDVLTSLTEINSSNAVVQTVYYSYDSTGKLTQITRPNGKKSILGYSGTNLVKVLDNATGYMLSITSYGNTKTLQEYANVPETMAVYSASVGQRLDITFDGNSTTFRTAGVDGIFDDTTTSDDILTVYQFDDYLRTVSAYSKSYFGDVFYGAEQQTYTSGGLVFNASDYSALNETEKFGFNKVKSIVSTGDSTKNLLSNGSFELALSPENSSVSNFCGGLFDCNEAVTGGSALSNYVSYSIQTKNETNPVMSGNKALKATVTSAGTQLRNFWYAPIAQVSALEPRTEYTFSAYVKAADNFDIKNAYLSVRIGNTEYLSQQKISATSVSDWQRLEVHFTTPSTISEQAKLCIKLTSVGSVFVDCAQLEIGPAANTVNFAENQGFENTDPVSSAIWQRVNLESADGVVDNNLFGSKAFKVVGNITSAKSITQTVPLASGTAARDFTLSAFAKANALPADENKTNRFFGIRARLVYLETTGEYSYSEVTQSAFNDRQTDWQYASLSLTSDASKNLYAVEITLAYEGQLGTCLFDNVSLEDNTVTSYEYDTLGNVVKIKHGNESETVNTYDGTDLESSAEIDILEDNSKQLESASYNQYDPITKALTHTAEVEATLSEDGEPLEINKVEDVSQTFYDSKGRLVYTQTGTEMLACYNFEGGNMIDSSGYLRHAYDYNVTTPHLEQLEERAAVFNENGYIAVPHFDPGDFFSVSFKVSLEEKTNWGYLDQTFLSKYDEDGNPILVIENGGGLIVRNGTQVIDYMYNTVGSSIAHIVVTFEKLSENKTVVHSYFNGNYNGSVTFNSALNFSDTDSPWYFGAEVDQNGNVIEGVKGWMDDITFYRGVLSKYEAQDLAEDRFFDVYKFTSTAQWTSYTYSDDGRFVVKEENSEGATITYDINGDTGLTNSVTTVDREGVSTTTQYAYNLDKTLSGVYYKSGNNTLEYNTYGYDSKGNITSIAHTGTQYTLAYNEWGQNTSVSIGNDALMTYTYKTNENGDYVNGPLLSQSFGGEAAKHQEFIYDALGNTVGRRFGGELTQTWAYDKLGNLVYENDIEDGTQTRYQYDAQSRLVNRSSSLLGSLNFTSQYLYDSNSNITEAAYNLSGTNLDVSISDNYTYDEDGKFVAGYSSDVKAQTEYEEYTDNIKKRSIVLKQANGSYSPLISESYSYYDRTETGKMYGAVSQITYNDNTKLSYQYDSHGRIIAEYKNGILYRSYAYDILGRLEESYLYDSEVAKAFMQSYGETPQDYDYYIWFQYYYEGNNLLQYGFIVLSDQSERLIDSNSFEYRDPWYDQIDYSGGVYYYDSIGNLTEYRNRALTWENGRELAQIKNATTNAVIADYEYDSGGLRISKTTATESVYYAYDENNNLIFEKHPDYTLAFHYDGNGVRTHFEHITSTATSTYFYRYNLQGDVIALIDSTGAVCAEYSYSPYGRHLTQITGIGAINPFRYRGYYFDSETDCYYLQSRYYDPYICRFINADDIAFLGASGTINGLNLYAYCEYDPVNYIDVCGTVKCYIRAATASSIRQSLLRSKGLWEEKYTVYIGFEKGKGTNYDYHIYRTPEKKRKLFWLIPYTTYKEVRYYMSEKTIMQWKSFHDKKYGWYYDMVNTLYGLTEPTVMDLLFANNPGMNIAISLASIIISRMPKDLKYFLTCIGDYFCPGIYEKNKNKKLTIVFGKAIYTYNSLDKIPTRFLYDKYLW